MNNLMRKGKCQLYKCVGVTRYLMQMLKFLCIDIASLTYKINHFILLNNGFQLETYVFTLKFSLTLDGILSSPQLWLWQLNVEEAQVDTQL